LCIAKTKTTIQEVMKSIALVSIVEDIMMNALIQSKYFALRKALKRYIETDASTQLIEAEIMFEAIQTRHALNSTPDLRDARRGS